VAVYTDITETELGDFLRLYEVGDLLSYKGIAEGSENSNFLLHTTTASFILTLYEKRVALGDVPFFLALMEHLARSGLNCPTPVRDAQGRNLGELAGRPAALVTFLDGVWMRRPRTEHCAAVGEALARLHLAGKGFGMHRRNALRLEDWRPLFDRFGDRTDEIAPGLGATIDAELTVLERNWPQNLETGIIHADLFPDNVFFLDNKLSGLIDFYFACHDTLAYDVAVCLNAWCFEADYSFNITKARAMLRSYAGVRPLPAGERAALPMLARGAALRFLLTRAYDWINTPADALVRRKDPLEYLRRLRFHQAVSHEREYGIEDAA
jgi:homoserine kinase type II